MKSFVVKKSPDLSGTISVQGAKNASNKLILVALLGEGECDLFNVPNIGTITNMMKLINLHGASASWIDENAIKITATDLDSDTVIEHDDFYYTSGAVNFVPIIASRYGKYTIPYPSERGDIGGCKIGGREIEYIVAQMEACGIESRREGGFIHFEKVSDAPFEYEVPVRSYAATLNTLIAALHIKGVSKIIKPTTDIEFESVIEFLKDMGADINLSDDVLEVNGGKPLICCNFKNPSDRNDFASLVSLALASNSELTIDNIDYEEMGLSAMDEVIAQMEAPIEYSEDSCLVRKHNSDLKPVDIWANRYPEFQTEWQVVFAPLLTQIQGTSTVRESIYSNRLQHWNELKKMGAKFEFFTDPKLKEVDGNPRAVEVYGPTDLKGAIVNSRDLRGGMAMLIAGAIAEGETVVRDAEEVFRGYENIEERLKSIGVDIKLVEG